MAEKAMKSPVTGYGATLAEVRFRLPGSQAVNSSFLWEGRDRAPDYPKLFEFLAGWQESIHGKLQSVTVSRRPLEGGTAWRKVGRRILLA
jgi:uncharacterized protein Usg